LRILSSSFLLSFCGYKIVFDLQFAFSIEEFTDKDIHHRFATNVLFVIYTTLKVVLEPAT